MEIKNILPPFTIYDRAVKQFGVDFNQGTIFTYGNTIFSKNDLDQYLVVHEKVHIKQQHLMGKDKWWDMYFTNPEFRYQQELEAYRAQYRQFTKMNRDRELIFKYLRMMALDLSGSMYGNMVTLDEAMKDIKK